MKKRNLGKNIVVNLECRHHDPELNCIISGKKACVQNCQDFMGFSNEPFQLSSKHISVLRNNLLTLQGGKCKICSVDLTKDSAACLDHHHQKKNKGSGLIRGVVCRTCNSFLAKSENNATRFRISKEQLPIILMQMASYLTSAQYPYMHPSEKPKVRKLTKLSYNRLVKAMKLAKENKIPEYPKSGTLTILLTSLCEKYKVIPEYYNK